MEALPIDILLLILDIFRINPEAYIAGPINERYCNKPYKKDQLEKYSTLCALTRVSRFFHSLVEPILYDTLIIDHEKLSLALIRTLCQTPRLGGLVQRLHLHRLRLGLANPETQKLFTSAVAHTALDARTRDEISRGLGTVVSSVNYQARAAFWLALTPNLRSVTVLVPRMPSLLAAVLSNPVDENTGSRLFPYLEDIRLRIGYHDLARGPALPMSSFESILHTPAVKSLDLFYLSWMSGMRRGAPEFVLPDLSCGIQHLLITRVGISLDAVENILSRCRDLRALRLDLRSSLESPLSCDRLGAILRAHASQVKAMHISFSGSGGLDAKPQELFSGKIGSLVGLKRLRHLYTSPHILIGCCKRGDESVPLSNLNLADLLPESIKTVQLTHVLWSAQQLERERSALMEDPRLVHLRRVRPPTEFQQARQRRR
ncbi:hypothetical protein ACJ41O_011930 [Fusarium nematophilum]